MKPMVPAQYDAAMNDALAAPDAMGHEVWSIPVPMPDRHNPYTLSYAVRGSDGSIVLIDTGYDTDENWAALIDGFRLFGLDLHAVRSVFVTHLHPDHLGMAERVREATGAQVVLHRREQQASDHLAEGPGDIEAKFDEWGVPEARRDELRVMARMTGEGEPSRADVLVDDGDVLDLPGRSLEVIWTPGHTPGHACLVDRDARLVFTGDHVLPNIYPGLGIGGATDTNPIADYFASLDRIDEFADFEVAPGHNYRFTGLAERTADIREHHLRRAREAVRVIGERPGASVFEVASQLPWSAGWLGLSGFRLYSALSQTEQHLGFVQSDAFAG